METTGATKWKIFDFVITEENQILPGQTHTFMFKTFNK